MADSATSPRTLLERIQALPQELQDMIEAEGFTAHSGVRFVSPVPDYQDSEETAFKFGRIFRAPDSLALLLVSKATSAHFLSSYDADCAATFVLECIGDACDWKDGLTDDQKAAVVQVRVLSTLSRAKFCDSEKVKAALFGEILGLKVMVSSSKEQLLRGLNVDEKKAPRIWKRFVNSY